MKTRRRIALVMALVMMSVMMIGMAPAHARTTTWGDTYVDPITWETIKEILASGGSANGLVHNTMFLDGFLGSGLTGKIVMRMYDGWMFEVLAVGGNFIFARYDNQKMYLNKKFCTPLDYVPAGSNRRICDRQPD